jgi:hypothetical protein
MRSKRLRPERLETPTKPVLLVSFKQTTIRFETCLEHLYIRSSTEARASEVWELNEASMEYG